MSMICSSHSSHASFSATRLPVLSRLAVACFAIVGFAAGQINAAGPTNVADDKLSTWFGYEQREFEVDGRNCLLVVPKSPASGKPWIWRTEFFGHEPQADVALLGKGFHVAYIDLKNMYGAPLALDQMDRFYEHLTQARGLASKTVLEGFSRGGLFSLNWAARRPERVACIYNDAPVCDFKSWPGGRGKSKGSPHDWRQLLEIYQLGEPQALSYQFNPVDNLAPLAKAKIPLLHVCGVADEVVPMEENTLLLERRYRELGGSILVISKPGLGHHPHSLANPGPIVAFVLDHTIGSQTAGFLPASPNDYQVFQRESRQTGKIHVSGWLDDVNDEANQRAVLCDVIAPAKDGVGEKQLASSVVIPFEENSRHYENLVDVPAGGWYRVELRAICDGAPSPAKYIVEHVGVGEVFVVAGQSNSTNHGSERQQTATGLVSAFDGATWAVAHDPQPGVQDNSEGGSFLPSFGDALAERYHVPIGVSSVGAGATSVRQWLPKGERFPNRPTINSHVRQVPPDQWEATGDLFDGLIKRVVALGPNGCRAILWHQGESDAGQARSGHPFDVQINGEQYREYMEKLVRASRQRIGWEIPWISAQATYHSPQDSADQEFRNAQRALWNTKVTLPGPDTDSLGSEYRAGVHFNAKGLEAHGKLWAEKVEAYLDAQLKDAAGKQE